MEIKREDIEKLLDLSYSYISQLHRIWNKTDGSMVGLIRILLIQEILKEQHPNGDYCGKSNLDELLNSLLNEYKTS